MTPLTNFLDIASLSTDQFWSLLRLAKRLKEERRELGQNEPILAGKTLGMLFQKPSLRTRVSFEMGMRHLGGHAIYIGPQEVGLGTRESVPDVARVLSGYVDGIMARVFAHEHVEQLAQWASVPVINGLSNTNHPCQALTDIFTMWEAMGFVDEKLAGLTVAFVGDGDNNIAYSLLAAAGKVGLSLRIVSPVGYQPNPHIVDATDADVTVTDDLEGVVGAQIVYTDVWTSMGWEAEREERVAALEAYRVDAALVERTRNRDVRVMHDLPAHRGEEITDAVMDDGRHLIFQQAHNRLHAQKALLAHLLGGVEE